MKFVAWFLFPVNSTEHTPLPPTNDFTVFGSERDVDLKDGELMKVEKNSKEVAEHKGHHNHHQHHL